MPQVMTVQGPPWRTLKQQEPSISLRGSATGTPATLFAGVARATLAMYLTNIELGENIHLTAIYAN